MRKVALVGVCLLFGLIAGLLLRPDDGTQVSISPAESGAMVSGANHGKPLPRVPSPGCRHRPRLVGSLSALVLVALLLAPGLSTVVRSGDDPPAAALLLARAGARRGPPARA